MVMRFWYFPQPLLLFPPPKSWRQFVQTLRCSGGGGGGGDNGMVVAVSSSLSSQRRGYFHPRLVRRSSWITKYDDYTYRNYRNQSTSIYTFPLDRVTKRKRRPIDMVQHARTFAAAAAAWWRGGANSGKFIHPQSPPVVTIDVSKKRLYPITIVNDEYRISICSIQGYREYMEDEFMIHTTTNHNHHREDDRSSQQKQQHQETTSDDNIHGIVGCFDGHGGKAVSRYLRQNLYTNLQAALQMIQRTKPVLPPIPLSIPTTNASESNTSNSMYITDDDDHDNECHRNDEGHSQHTDLDINNINNLKVDDEYLVSGIPSTTTIVIPPTTRDSLHSSYTLSGTSNSMANIHTSTATATVDDYVSALEVALDKVDREVLKVRHWKHQGSTAIVCWIHTATTTTEIQSSNTSQVGTDIESSMTPKNEAESDIDQRIQKSMVRTLITANIGDSRAILCRNGTAIALSRDHKPNDPIEYQRIRQLGGSVIWDGEVDRMREPIPGMGCYRVNGNLALSRVIGDRSDRPVVNSDPDITLITLLPNDDEFIVVATDGLWDVMSSSDTVAFIRALLDNMDQDAIDRDSVATYVIEEALRRGSQDNITVIIIWLK